MYYHSAVIGRIRNERDLHGHHFLTHLDKGYMANPARLVSTDEALRRRLTLVHSIVYSAITDELSGRLIGER